MTIQHSFLPGEGGSKVVLKHLRLNLKVYMYMCLYQTQASWRSSWRMWRRPAGTWRTHPNTSGVWRNRWGASHRRGMTCTRYYLCLCVFSVSLTVIQLWWPHPAGNLSPQLEKFEYKKVFCYCSCSACSKEEKHQEELQNDSSYVYWARCRKRLKKKKVWRYTNTFLVVFV